MGATHGKDTSAGEEKLRQRNELLYGSDHQPTIDLIRDDIYIQISATMGDGRPVIYTLGKGVCRNTCVRKKSGMEEYQLFMTPKSAGRVHMSPNDMSIDLPYIDIQPGPNSKWGSCQSDQWTM